MRDETPAAAREADQLLDGRHEDTIMCSYIENDAWECHYHNDSNLEANRAAVARAFYLTALGPGSYSINFVSRCLQLSFWFGHSIPAVDPVQHDLTAPELAI